jgi:CHAD domain-containing protein
VGLSPDDPASTLVTPLLREQVAALRELQPAVLDDRPDAVHQMRVTMRRIRSALATFRPILVRDHAEALRGELRWLSGVLGEARDLEVMRERLRELVAREPPELLLGPVAARVDTDLGHAHRTAHARAVEAIGSPRYAALLQRLDAFVADPPFTPQANDSVGDVTRRRMRNDWRRLMGQRGRRAQHLVRAGPQRGQPRHQLARPALDAAELGPDGGAGVDRDRTASIGHHDGAL